jgi:anti-sigma B factor antagonist
VERPPEALEIAVSSRPDGAIVLALEGELDLGTAPVLAHRLQTLPGGPPWRVVLDLAQLTFVDSRGISVLVAGSHGLEASEGWLRLAAPTPNVRRVLEIAHLPEEVLVVAPSVDAALGWPGGAATG